MNTSTRFSATAAWLCIAFLVAACNDDTQVSTVVDADHPRLVSAISTSNTSIKVTFSELVTEESAEEIGNYQIVGAGQSAVPPAKGGAPTVKPYLMVVGSDLLGDGLSVELTTLSQSDIEYELTVAGVTDLNGNPIAGSSGQDSPAKTVFSGTAPNASSLVDSDSDGLPDSAEQRGWTIKIILADGSEVSREVSSDPFSADTDGDGMLDPQEKNFGIDPRSGDTDGDELGDYLELNDIYSNPAAQDSDGDSLQDGLEFNFFRTSPLMADTDGDQLSDFQEIKAANRNPLVADLPRPLIRVGNVNLQLDTRFTFVDEQGVSRSSQETVESTLTQSENELFRTSDENTTKSVLETSRTLEAEVSFPKGGGVKSSMGINAGLERGHTSTFGSESSTGAEERYHESLTTSEAVDYSKSVTREVVGASVKADVTIENTSDIPFTISKLELAAQTQDPRDRRRLIPVASLVPENPSFGAINIGALGDPQRGPFVFAAFTDSVFPAQVEQLLKSPRGLIVKLANFDITDEAGRNFAYSSQQVLDRTAGINIDFGDGRVLSYRVATASTHDWQGRPRGITMAYALNDIIGLSRYPGIRDGGNGTVNTTAQGDDVQIHAPGSQVDPSVRVIGAGPNGVIDSAPSGDDTLVGPDYATTRVLRDSDGDGTDDVTVEILSRVLEVETGMTDLVVGDGLDERETFWVVFASRTLDPRVNFNDLTLRAGDQFNLAFVQDRDRDGVWAREEYLHGSSDRRVDTDGDGLSDRQEIQDGWLVQVRGAPEAIRVYPNPVQEDSDRDGIIDSHERACSLDPRSRDTDMDGLTDWEELHGQLIRDGGAIPMEIRDPLTGVFRAIVPRYTLEVILDGGNGVAESLPAGDDVVNPEVVAGGIVIGAGQDGFLQSVPAGDDLIAASHEPLGICLQLLGLEGFATDPLNDDTDGDLIEDGSELRLGINPNNRQDGPLFLDDDGDGVANLLEDRGFVALINGLDVAVNSSKFQADSDSDGLPDLLEHYLMSNPQVRDTDGDGLLDAKEFANGRTCVTLTRTPQDPCIRFEDKQFDNYRDFLLECAQADVCFLDEEEFAGHPGTNLNEADSDYDGVPDPDELGARTIAVNGELVTLPAPVSDPLLANSDSDTLDDGMERLYGTDPRNPDTDGDETSDSVEVEIGTNPLVADQRVTFQYSSIFAEGCKDGNQSNPEFVGSWRITRSGETPVTLFSANGSTISIGTNLLTAYGVGPVSRELVIGPQDSVIADSSGTYEKDDGSIFDPHDDITEFSETFGAGSLGNQFPLKSQVKEFEQSSDGEVCLRTTLSVIVTNTAAPLFAVVDIASTNEDSAVTIQVLANDLLGSQPTTITSVTQPGNGVVTISDPTSTLTYTPAPDFNGGEEFTYSITDSVGQGSTGSVVVTVNPVNDGVPLAQDDPGAATVAQDSTAGVDTVDVLANDVLVDGARIIDWDGVSANGATVGYNGDGTFHYVPAVGFSGDDSFTYTLGDQDGETDAATVTVTVTP